MESKDLESDRAVEAPKPWKTAAAIGDIAVITRKKRCERERERERQEREMERERGRATFIRERETESGGEIKRGRRWLFNPTPAKRELLEMVFGRRN